MIPVGRGKNKPDVHGTPVAFRAGFPPRTVAAPVSFPRVISGLWNPWTAGMVAGRTGQSGAGWRTLTGYQPPDLNHENLVPPQL